MPLLLVATPIGHLGDISYRAVRALDDAELILAEDTRTSAILLRHYGIETPMKSYHSHNENQSAQYWAERIEQGQRIALISEAGTPMLSDPGFPLMQLCIERHIPVEIFPGATAFLPALMLSGFAMHEFKYWGFLPQKKGKKTQVENILNEEQTSVFYESPHRLLKTLELFRPAHEEQARKMSVSREITKKYEETQRGTADELISHFTKYPIKGEFVICLEGKQQFLKRMKKDEKKD